MPIDSHCRLEETLAKPAENAHQFCGRHLLASYCECERSALSDVRQVSAALRAAVAASGATLLKSLEHVFPPHGVTAVALLAESHASLHTYPEHGACFVDIFTCGVHCDVEAFDAELRRHLRPQKVTVQIVERFD
jgi:S-adenosylmethionine decarboxylase proenzyme